MKLLIFMLAASFAHANEIQKMSSNTQWLQEQNTFETFSAAPNLNSTNYFSKLEKTFASAQSVTLAETTGFWTGRCARSNTQTTLEGGLLVSGVVTYKVGDESNGPLFPVQTKSYIDHDVYLGGSQPVAPTYYDTLSSSSKNNIAAAQYEFAMALENKKYDYSVRNTSSGIVARVEHNFPITIGGNNGNLKNINTSVTRKSENYLVLHFTQISEYTDIIPENNKTDKLEIYCYFISRVE